MLGLSLRADRDASAPLNSVLRDGGKLQPAPPRPCRAGSRDRASGGRVTRVKVEKAERSCLGAGLRGELTQQARGTSGSRPGTATEEPATSAAWSLLRAPHLGTPVKALANSGESLPRLQNPQAVPYFLPRLHYRAPQHTRAHTLL